METGGISGTEKAKYYVISLTHGIQRLRTHRKRGDTGGGCQGLEAPGKWEMLGRGCRLAVCRDESGLGTASTADECR